MAWQIISSQTNFGAVKKNLGSNRRNGGKGQAQKQKAHQTQRVCWLHMHSPIYLNLEAKIMRAAVSGLAILMVIN